MTKKKESNWIMAGIIILVVVILFNKNWQNPTSSIIQTQKTFEEGSIYGTNLNTGGAVTSSIPDVNLCNSFTENYPTYFMVKEVLCQAVGGEYICEANRAGCYTITSWDNVAGCSSSQAQLLKAFCSTQGGDWTCDAIEISCEI